MSDRLDLDVDTSCGGCLFAMVRDIRVIGCMAHEKTIGLLALIGGNTPRPSWCPLDKGPVTELRKRHSGV